MTLEFETYLNDVFSIDNAYDYITLENLEQSVNIAEKDLQCNYNWLLAKICLGKYKLQSGQEFKNSRKNDDEIEFIDDLDIVITKQ